MRRLRVLLFLFAFCLLFQPRIAAQVRETRRVIIINEMEPWLSGVNAVEREIFAALQKSSYQIELYSEDLDTAQLPNETYRRQARDWYVAKYRGHEPDLVIAVGPTPIKFMASLRELFSLNTPIIFWGSTEESAEPPKLDAEFTGVWGIAQPEKTLDLALSLKPGTKHVVVVGGVAPYDRYLEAVVKQRLQSYESTLDFIYLTDLAMPALLDRLKHLPSNTIVFHTSMMQDAAGARFFDTAQSVPMVASAANVPVFVMDEVDVSGGAVGGNVFSVSLAGQTAGAMAIRILHGEKPRDIPTVRGTSAYVFDWPALKRWGFNESGLPLGSVVLNRQPSLWEVYRPYILAGALLLFVQALIITGLLWQRAQRRQVQAALIRSNEQLRLAMDAGKSVGWDLDVKSGLDSWFGDLRTMFGISADTVTVLAGDFYRYIHPEDRERFSETVSKSRKSREPYAAEFRIVWPDGTTRWVVARGKYDYARNGEAKRMLGMAVDITERKQVEEALKKSEEKFSRAFRESPLAFTLTSARDHRYIEVNETFERLTGWGREEVIDRTPFDIGLWVDPAQRYELVRRLLAEGSIRNVEIRFRTKQGEVRTGLGSSELIEIDREPCVVSVVADVTELKRAEEAKETSEQRFKQFFNVLPEYCYMVSPGGLILDVNPAACEVFGYAKEELIGRSLSTLYAPESVPRIVALFEKWKRTGTLDNEEVVILTKHGKKRTVLLNAGSLKDAQGNLLYSASVQVDITEQKQIQEKLRESEERFRLVANSAPVMIWMSGPDRLRTYFNQPWLVFTGHSIQAELGDGWAGGVYPEDRERCLSAYTKAFDQRERFEMEYRLRRHDGEYRWVSDLGVPRMNLDGSFAGYIGSCLDVTERKQAEEALSSVSRRLIEAHEEERTWIARELHDDINQRIALLAVSLERLKLGLPASASAASQGLAEIAEQVLDIGSDIQALSHRLHSSRLEYLGIQAAAASLCKELAEKQGVQVHFNSEEVPPKLPQEVALCLFRVLQEALQNALKHSGSLHFEVSLKGAWNAIQLTVHDSGTGFDPDEATKGRGLGLTSMKERVKLVHGQLSIDSGAQRGTLIRVTVPLEHTAVSAQA